MMLEGMFPSTGGRRPSTADCEERFFTQTVSLEQPNVKYTAGGVAAAHQRLVCTAAGNGMMWARLWYGNLTLSLLHGLTLPRFSDPTSYANPNPHQPQPASPPSAVPRLQQLDHFRHVPATRGKDDEDGNTFQQRYFLCKEYWEPATADSGAASEEGVGREVKDAASSSKAGRGGEHAAHGAPGPIFFYVSLPLLLGARTPIFFEIDLRGA